MPPPTPTAPVREGDVIEGKFRVEKVLGQGGMGIVVGAHHLHLDQRVAIKFLFAASDQAIERFLREAKAAVRLKSEHVCKVLDVGKLQTGEPYMVMEYLQGHDLGAELIQRGKLSVQEVADHVLQACEAIAEAHSVGIVHRDIKPQNLFLTQGLGGQPMVKVLDFGISKITDGQTSSMTQTTSVMGSPIYMAPEQMMSAKNVVPQSDVWALGVVMQELLTGNVPFEADTIPELALKVVGQPARPITKDRNDVPGALVSVVERCLEKKPEARFANAAELAEALEAFGSSASQAAAQKAKLLMTTGRLSMTSGRASQVPAKLPSSAATIQTTPPELPSGKQTFSNPTIDAPKKGGQGAIIAVAGAVAAVALAAVAFFLTRPAPQAPAPDAPKVTASQASGQAAEPKAAPTASAQEPAVAPAASSAPPAASSAPAKTKAKTPTGGSPVPTKPAGDDLPSIR